MNKTILVVDDSASIRSVLGIALKREGYDVITAEDGVDALEKLDGQKINLIISDVNMPRMDGITLVKEVKKLPSHKFTPICMLTTEAGQEMMNEGKMAGAKAWLVKPFQPPQLLDVVSRLLPC